MPDTRKNAVPDDPLGDCGLGECQLGIPCDCAMDGDDDVGVWTGRKEL